MEDGSEAPRGGQQPEGRYANFFKVGYNAFEFVFDEVGVAASMFGMGTIEQVAETARAAREVLGAA